MYHYTFHIEVGSSTLLQSPLPHIVPTSCPLMLTYKISLCQPGGVRFQVVHVTEPASTLASHHIHIHKTGVVNNINTYTARPVCWSGWISDSCCSLKPLCSGMGEVVPARTSPTLLPPSPRTVLSLSCFKVSQCISCRDWHCKS